METIIFNSDLLFYLYNFLSSANEKSAICCVNNYLYKICRSKSYFSIQKENLMLELYNKNNKNNNIFNCINFNCNNIYSKKAMQHLIFFYPKYLTKKNDKEDNIFINWIRQIECKNGNQIKRFIPYCKDCMIKYVNKGNIVPYGYNCEYIMNL